MSITVADTLQKNNNNNNNKNMNMKIVNSTWHVDKIYRIFLYHK